MAKRLETIANPDPTTSPDIAKEVQSLINSGAAIPIQGGSQVQFQQDVNTPALDAFRGMPTDITGSLDTLRGGNPLASLDQYKSFLNTAGIATSSANSDFEAFQTKAQAEAEARIKANTEQLNREAALRQGQIEQAGKYEEGGYRSRGAIAGGSGQTGLGQDSSVIAAIGQARKETQTAINDLMARKERAVLENKTAEEARLDLSIQKYLERQDMLVDRENELRFKAINSLLAIKQDEREQEKFAFEKDQAKLEQAKDEFAIVRELPEGQTINLGGQTFTGIKKADPFFNSGNIVELMKSTPMGQEFQLEDPASGQLWTVTGIASTDPKLKQFTATDDKGNFRIINYDPTTGQIVGVAEAGNVGKTKTAAPSVTLNIRAETGAALAQAQSALDATVSNGFYDVGTYVRERNKFAQLNGGNVKPFDDTFKFKLDPSDPKALPYATGKVSEDEEESLF